MARTKGAKGLSEADRALEGIMRRLEKISAVAILIKTHDGMPLGPARNRLAARVDRLMARLQAGRR